MAEAVVPVAVFFLPKHCTLWEAMMGDCVSMRACGGGREVAGCLVVVKLLGSPRCEIESAARTTHASDSRVHAAIT